MPYIVCRSEAEEAAYREKLLKDIRKRSGRRLRRHGLRFFGSRFGGNKGFRCRFGHFYGIGSDQGAFATAVQSPPVSRKLCNSLLKLAIAYHEAQRVALSTAQHEACRFLTCQTNLNQGGAVILAFFNLIIGQPYRKSTVVGHTSALGSEQLRLLKRCGNPLAAARALPGGAA